MKKTKSKKTKSAKKVSSVPVPLSPSIEEMYLRRKALKDELTKLTHRMTELTAIRRDVDKALAPYFEKHGNRRSLSDGTVVERKETNVEEQVCTPEMVGTILRAGYSYSTYKEIAGKYGK